MAIQIAEGAQVKLAAVTFGTEGDTRPIATLCSALRDAGHDVTLLAAEGTLGSARDLDVPHTALAGDIRSMLQPRDGGAGLNAATRALSRVANDNATAWMRQTLESATGSDAIICAGLAAFVGFSVAEKLDVPALGAGMIPLTPTAEFPSSFLPPRRVPRWLNRFSHRFVAEMLWRAFRRAINEARVGVCGLPPRSKLWSAYPMLYGISPSLLPKPTDWPSNAFMLATVRLPNAFGRSETPITATLRGAKTIATEEAEKLWRSGAASFVDVLPRPPRPRNLPEGTLWRDKPRDNIPDSIWLPDTGYGELAPSMADYFSRGLEKATRGDHTRLIVLGRQAVAVQQRGNPLGGQPVGARPRRP